MTPTPDAADSSGRTSSDPTPLERLRTDLQRYVEKRIELLALDLTEPVSLVVAKILQLTLGLLIVLTGFILVLVAAGYALAGLLDSTELGFLAVGLPVLLAGLVVALRTPKWLLTLIQGAFMRSILDAMAGGEGDPAASRPSEPAQSGTRRPAASPSAHDAGSEAAP